MNITHEGQSPQKMLRQLVNLEQNSKELENMLRENSSFTVRWLTYGQNHLESVLNK